jgi:hypothetical protein
VDFWHVGDVLDFVKQVNEEQLGDSSGSGSSEGGDGVDTDTGAGGTITSG